MSKAEKDSMAVRSEIDSSLFQINKHIKELDSKGITIKEAYLLWNRSDAEEELQTKLQTKYNELFKNHGFVIICPEDIENFVTDIKSNESTV